MDRIVIILGGLARELILDTDDLTALDALAVAAQAGGASGLVSLLEMARLIGEAADDAGAVVPALDRVQEASGLWRMADLVAACFAVSRASYASRQDAQAARSAINARAETTYQQAGVYGPEAIEWLVSLAGIAALHLSRTAAERAPAVLVETGLSLPSTLLAYDLYADAGRAGELVDRNRIATALVMPVAFEAVAP
ncbi:hypothetical protein LL06_00715 [Hoeflea sp. BAL378]|uniref:hypothetical protein n=1 Tax=Hoeflea sp. BAL378 TaxID=1547437 RepID=UPI0005136050|nr:hypothetical protein [Hoeflea sp. BAL378]KGF71153.1 hypothetical protein LL06_00715 [Hoeflea sp. BAL378]